MVSSAASLTLEAFKSAADVTPAELALIAALEQIQARNRSRSRRLC